MSQKQCEICNKNLSKYTCPVCQIKFCCVACFKIHKEAGACVKLVKNAEHDQNSRENQGQVYEYTTEDTVSIEKLKLLGYDKHVRNDLTNRHLRHMLEYINSSENPDKSIEEAMKEPIFLEFVTHCLKVADENH